MRMDATVYVQAHLSAAPGDLVGWLHNLALVCTHGVDARAGVDADIDPAVEISAAPLAWVVGPHTFVASAPSPHETLALYGVPPRLLHSIADRQVALAVTYVPLRSPQICLDLRAWPLLPLTLDSLLAHLSTQFAQANPVLSSVLPLTAAVLPSGAGAARLACNRWLDDQLAGHEGAPRQPRQLYVAWAEQYRALRGEYPADPKRSFRAAVAGSRARLRCDP